MYTSSEEGRDVVAESNKIGDSFGIGLVTHSALAGTFANKKRMSMRSIKGMQRCWRVNVPEWEFVQLSTTFDAFFVLLGIVRRHQTFGIGWLFLHVRQVPEIYVHSLVVFNQRKAV